jgi:hydrogen peroxide-dependent heme synthase
MSDPQADIKSNAAKINELNDTVRFTMWSVFKLERPIGSDDVVRKGEAAEVEALISELAADDVVVRGVYDVAGLRADADLMVWWHAATSDQLQRAYHLLRRTALGTRLTPVWSQMALHRPA